MPRAGKDAAQRLDAYRRKRSRSGTTEPFGGTSAPSPRPVFVVQKHRATSLHWDVRLEMDGVLVSWAVPKGPSPNQADKRLAVLVEDHPLEYAEYEGVIPAGSYGAGPMIIWDSGVWKPVGDPRKEMAKGKLLFDLFGYKLRGRWTLIKTKGGAENHWLLIKERDAYEDPSGRTEDYPDDSIISGLTVDDLARGGDFGKKLRDRCEALGAPRGKVAGERAWAMLAHTSEQAFSRRGWFFEVKYDGYRALGTKRESGLRLLSRNSQDLTHAFPEVARALGGLRCRSIALDGEVVVHDDRGLPDFSLIQRRGRLVRAADILSASLELPATYYVFDLLEYEGFDLRSLTVEKRRALLKEALPTTGPLRFSESVEEKGELLFEKMKTLGLEGVVAKRAGSPYAAGRSDAWRKIRVMQEAEFLICGYTEPKAGGAGFGALHLSEVAGKMELYRGKVGTGFTDALQEELGRALRRLPPRDPPPGAVQSSARADRWVDQRLSAKVRFREMSPTGRLRHPSFVGFRQADSAQATGAPQPPRLPEPAPARQASSERRVVHYSNLDKVFWPEEQYTKRDLIRYYRRVAPWILPHLRDRPVVLTRFPNGIRGKSFYQKNAPDFAPSWIRRLAIFSEGSNRTLDYFIVDDEESLLYIANAAAIPLHVWQSRASSLSKPDYAVLDLDPKDAPFSSVVKIALFLRELCDEIGLANFVKTSGSSGLHVLIPLGGAFAYRQSRVLAEILAIAVVSELGDIATVERRPSRRDGKVYVDYAQNGHGRLIAAPYCVRPLRGAPVSCPLEWDELGAETSIADFTIRTMPRRMREIKSDPLAGVLGEAPDLPGSIRRLERRFRAS